MYNLFPIKEVEDLPENDRRPPCPMSHRHLPGDPLSCQQTHQANPIPHYYPPYCATGNPTPPPVGAIYNSLSPSPLCSQHEFDVIPPSDTQHGFSIVPPPTGPGYVGFKDDDLPDLTDQELREIYNNFMADRQARKERGEQMRGRHMKSNRMGEVNSP